MNVLTFGVPPQDFMQQVQQKKGTFDALYCCESRPYEQGVSEWIFSNSQQPITILTDNMVASLCSESKIDLFITFGEFDNDEVRVISGTKAILDLCEHFIIKTAIGPTVLPVKKKDDEFFGTSIVVPNSKNKPSAFEILHKNNFDEVL